MRAALFAFSRGGCVTARRILAALLEEAWMCYTLPRFEEPGFLPLDKAVYGASFSSMDKKHHPRWYREVRKTTEKKAE